MRHFRQAAGVNQLCPHSAPKGATAASARWLPGENGGALHHSKSQRQHTSSVCPFSLHNKTVRTPGGEATVIPRYICGLHWPFGKALVTTPKADQNQPLGFIGVYTDFNVNELLVAACEEGFSIDISAVSSRKTNRRAL